MYIIEEKDAVKSNSHNTIKMFAHTKKHEITEFKKKKKVCTAKTKKNPIELSSGLFTHH